MSHFINYFHYRSCLPDSNIPFTQGMNWNERQAFEKAMNGPTTSETEQQLKYLTGCQTFIDFKERLLPKHELIDEETSVLLFTAIDLTEGNEKLSVELRIYKGEYLRIGTIRRSLDKRTNTVWHRLFEVTKAYRGRGLGTYLSQSHEEAWRAAGYSSIRLEAAKEQGRLFWAEQGYGFDRDTDSSVRLHRAVNDRLEIMTAMSRRKENPFLDYNEVAEMTRKLSGNPFEPWEMLMLSVQNLNSPDSPFLIGKDALQENNWYGYKELGPDWPGHGIAYAKRKVILP